MEKFKEILDTFVFYFLLYLGYIIEGIKYIATIVSSYIEAVIVPVSIPGKLTDKGFIDEPVCFSNLVVQVV